MQRIPELWFGSIWNLIEYLLDHGLSKLDLKESGPLVVYFHGIWTKVKIHKLPEGCATESGPKVA